MTYWFHNQSVVMLFKQYMITRYSLMCFECVIKCSHYNMFFIWNRKLTTEEVEAIGTAFAAETNRRDEDTEMFVSIHISDSYLIVQCNRKLVQKNPWKIILSSNNILIHCTYMYKEINMFLFSGWSMLKWS